MTPTVIVYELYIALSVADFIVLIFALVLVCGNERTDVSNRVRVRAEISLSSLPSSSSVAMNAPMYVIIMFSWGTSNEAEG